MANADDELILPDLLKILNQQLTIKETILQAIKSYHGSVKQIVKSMSEQGQALPENPAKYIFASKYNHEETLKGLLDFLAYVIVQSNCEEISFGDEGIKLLWNLFVQNPNFEIDQEIFLKWINSSNQSQQEQV